jgi:hypothetical protein
MKEMIWNVEQQRLRALVNADMVTARRIHADDFQLFSRPSGGVYSKERYMREIESGLTDYRIWDPGEITVRLYGDAAVIRYADVGFEVFQKGALAWSGIVRHTDLEEKRNGQWQVVWSQASGGKAPEGGTTTLTK